jgi:hypothetical protein
MDETTKTIIEQLKVSEQAGLSYYEAEQKLLEAGYTSIQINDALDTFKYKQLSEPKVSQVPDELYQGVADGMAKDAAKKPLPGWLTVWSPSSYGLHQEVAAANMQAGSDKLKGVLVGLVVSFLLLGVFQAFPSRITDNVSYCGATSSCVTTKAASYGWPAHGEKIEYTVEGSNVGETINVYSYEQNFAVYFLATCLVLFMANIVRTRF